MNITTTKKNKTFFLVNLSLCLHTREEINSGHILFVSGAELNRLIYLKLSFSRFSWLFDESFSGEAAVRWLQAGLISSSVIAHLPQTQKDINDAVSEVWCQSESWRLRQFTHAYCVVRPRGERHVLHWNDATLKSWILKMYQWSAHVMWHSLLSSELSFDPVFIKRWGAHRNRQVLLWLHVYVCVCHSRPALS